MTIQDAALIFRFAPWESIPEEVKTFLEENTRAVADILPRSKGLELYDQTGAFLPSGYFGLPEPKGSEAWKDKMAYQKLRQAYPSQGST
jgi:hypothetical protein